MGNFRQNDRGSSSRFSKRDSSRFRGRDSDRFSRGASSSRGRDSDRSRGRDSEQSFEKKMHSVTCDKCGERCEVPFRPTEGKPVYCYNCFKKEDNHESKHSTSKNEFDQINEKLNKIMKKLDIK